MWLKATEEMEMDLGKWPVWNRGYQLRNRPRFEWWLNYLLASPMTLSKLFTLPEACSHHLKMLSI